MQNNRLETFTNRREAIALFEHLRKNDPNKPWPLLPILTFIAPDGGGKSTLIEYLRASKCCLPDGRAMLPYAYIDFAQVDAPRDLLSILVALRNQLQAHGDGQGRNLTFPYFDLGAAIALATPGDGELPFFKADDIQRKLTGAWPYFESLNEMGYALGNIIPIIPPLLAGLKSGVQIIALQELLHRLEYSSGWHWYRLHGSEMGLFTHAKVSDVLLRLYALSRTGKADRLGREYLVQHVLPAALLADLREALDSASGPSAWNETTNVVLFLDSFDTLLSGSDSVGTGIEGQVWGTSSRGIAHSLLEMLTLGEHRKRGETDPLLVVIGSKVPIDRAPNIPPVEAERIETRSAEPRQLTSDAAASTSAQSDKLQGVRSAEHPSSIDRPSLDSSVLYEHWRQQLPDDKQARGKPYLYSLRELYLPLELHNFDLDDTSNYLLKLGEQRQTTVFTATGLVQAIHRFTRGYPLYLALAAACVIEAETHAKNLEPADFTGFEDDPPSSVGTGEELSGDGGLVPVRGGWETRYEDASIAEYLCSLYLHQLSRQEEDNLVFCALPRMLDIETLQIVLQLPDDDEIQQQWDRYRRLPFVHSIDGERIVFHPIVRNLLLQRLPPTSVAERNYHRIHTRLREHFHRRATLLRSAQALPGEPAELQGGKSGGLPGSSSAVAGSHFKVKDNSAVARVARMKGNEYARIEESYHALALGDPESAISLALFAQRARLALWEPLLDAITEAPTALMQVHTRQQAADALATAMQHHRTQDIVVAIVLYTWLLGASQEDKQKVAEIQNNLGAAYWTLASGDRQANLEKAIAYYRAALQVYTCDGFPIDWATTQNNLGAAYWTLASFNRQDRQASLEQAIACSKAALQVYTLNAFPADWARTQYNLGRAYNDLPDENRRANLEQTIACYQAALQVYTRDDFPAVWAKTNDGLGNAYLSLPGENRQENLQKAIDCYNAALEIYTHQSFPVAWARARHRLGDAYRDVIDEDSQQANLKKAIAYYQSALQVYTRESFPTEWAEVQESLGYTYASLQSTDSQDRQANLEQAVACYQAALQVYTRDAFPSNWASTQNNLGFAYAFLPVVDSQNQQANLEKAIVCYEGALQVFSSLQLDDYVQLVSNNLADAQERLQQC